jgi:hypothetical protein
LKLFACVLLLLQNMKDASIGARSAFGGAKHLLVSFPKPDATRSFVDAKTANVSKVKKSSKAIP